LTDALARRADARLLEVRLVEIVSRRGRSVTLSSVRCPVRDRSSAVEACAECRQAGAIAQDALARGEWLGCGAPREEARAGRSERRVGEVMRRSAVALRATLPRDEAADALRARGLASAPVVDGDGRPIGVVAEADLLRAPPGTTAADAMARVALAVHDAAPVARAAALMATHRADAVAVVAGDGVIVGVLSASDLVAWLAGGGAR
jgi:CBS domain-containing protein